MITLEYFKELRKKMERYNNFSPFPVYDTGYVEYVTNLIDIMETNGNKYDEISLDACKYCDNTHLKFDELDNTICMNCGAINDFIEYENIFEYKRIIEEKRNKV